MPDSRGTSSGTGLVLFDSWFGNTEAVARAIALGLGEQAGTLPVSMFVPGRKENLALIVVGGPTHRREASPSVMRFLLSTARASTDTPMAVFDTRLRMPRWRSGSAARLTARALRRLGVHVIGVNSFLVDGMQGPLAAGELVRAEEWGRALRAVLNRSPVLAREGRRAA
jgi:flavorubredoxin